MSRANQWFVPGDGIAREVITADIQRYLGPDALVRPGSGTGEYQGQPGYWITAYRTLTSQMIQDLKMDSQRWQQERQPGDTRGGSHSPQVRTSKVSVGSNASLVAYQDSRTHAARQHWGPSKPFDQGSSSLVADAYDQTRGATTASSRTPAYGGSSSSYSSDPHYTTAPTSTYGSSHPGYQPPGASAAPRTSPADPYSSYSQPGGRDYPAQSPYNAYPAATPDPYGRQAPSQSAPYTASSATAAAPGYYIASDGRQYPLSQQPQSSRNPQSGASRYSTR